MEAVILAGGKGTRLRPYTTTIPKPLVPVGERAILDIILHQLRAAGCSRVRLAVNHMADLIMAYCGDGARYGLPIEYAREEEPLGTVGPVGRLTDLPEHFLVMNGDILTDLDYTQLIGEHVRTHAELTVATYARDVQVDFGVLELEPTKRRVTGFREKPIYHFDVSMGVYVFSRSLLDLIPAEGPYGFDQMMLDLLAADRSILAYPYQGFWLDLGRPDDYERANLEATRTPCAWETTRG